LPSVSARLEEGERCSTHLCPVSGAVGVGIERAQRWVEDRKAREPARLATAAGGGDDIIDAASKSAGRADANRPSRGIKLGALGNIEGGLIFRRVESVAIARRCLRVAPEAVGKWCVETSIVTRRHLRRPRFCHRRLLDPPTDQAVGARLTAAQNPSLRRAKIRGRRRAVRNATDRLRALSRPSFTLPTTPALQPIFR